MASTRVALVTGAAGFVGANLVRRLLAGGDRVCAAVRDASACWRLEDIAAELELAEVDLRREEDVRALVHRVRPDHVYHLAAHGAYSWQVEGARILATNVLGTAHLLEAALECGVDAFVHAGSSSEYGLKTHAPSEDEVLVPNSQYAVAKAAASMACAHAARAHDAHVVTLRLYSAYGPWEDPRRLIPRLVAEGRRRTLPPLAAPDTARDFIHVDDVVEAFVRVACATTLPRGTLLNVGSGCQTRLRDIVELARQLFGINDEPVYLSGNVRGWDTDVWVADARRIREFVGWEARTDLRSGLHGMQEWVATNAERIARYEAGGSA